MSSEHAARVMLGRTRLEAYEGSPSTRPQGQQRRPPSQPSAAHHSKAYHLIFPGAGPLGSASPRAEGEEEAHAIAFDEEEDYLSPRYDGAFGKSSAELAAARHEDSRRGKRTQQMVKERQEVINAADAVQEQARLERLRARQLKKSKGGPPRESGSHSQLATDLQQEGLVPSYAEDEAAAAAAAAPAPVLSIVHGFGQEYWQEPPTYREDESPAPGDAAHPSLPANTFIAATMYAQEARDAAEEARATAAALGPLSPTKQHRPPPLQQNDSLSFWRGDTPLSDRTWRESLAAAATASPPPESPPMWSQGGSGRSPPSMREELRPADRIPSPRRSSGGTPRQASPRQVSPRQVSPRQVSPRQVSPRQASPRQVSPRQASSHAPTEANVSATPMADLMARYSAVTATGATAYSPHRPDTSGARVIQMRGPSTPPWDTQSPSPRRGSGGQAADSPQAFLLTSDHCSQLPPPSPRASSPRRGSGNGSSASLAENVTQPAGAAGGVVGSSSSSSSSLGSTFIGGAPSSQAQVRQAPSGVSPLPLDKLPRPARSPRGSGLQKPKAAAILRGGGGAGSSSKASTAMIVVV